jgi:hypothetical protein
MERSAIRVSRAEQDRPRTFAAIHPGYLLRQARSAASRVGGRCRRIHDGFRRAERLAPDFATLHPGYLLPSAETAAMLLWALLASGQINMRKVDGWQTLATKPIDQPIDLAA